LTEYGVVGDFEELIMLAVSDPNMVVAGYAIGGLILAGLWRLYGLLFKKPVKPDPWGAEVERQLQAAQEVCPHCSTPQPPDAWFCARCDNPVGPYHSFTPYVYQFSDGGVFRNGASGHRTSVLVAIGYLLLSLGKLGLFGPFYWMAFMANQRRIRQEDLERLRNIEPPPA
jgi:hypothetical protein